MRFSTLFCLVLVLLSLVACKRRGEDLSPDRELAIGESALSEVQPKNFPYFSLRDSNRIDMLDAIAHSKKYLGAPSSKKVYPLNGITHEQVVRGLTLFQQILETGPSDSELNDFIRQNFRVYQSVGYDRKGSVLFTGYYTPIFPASTTPTARFRYPLYKRPADLVPNKDHKKVAQQRLPNGSLRIYPTRAKIERSHMLKGQELVYLDNPWDVYTIQVQGSGFLDLPDGRRVEVGYDGTNGHEYRSIGLALVAKGLLRKEDLSLENLEKYFQQNPGRLQPALDENPRFVFFKFSEGGPYGSLGQAVTTNISIATDKSIFPRGALTFVDTRLTAGYPRAYRAFRLDQDTGGAIRAPGRCDLYMGVGDSAERDAGGQYANGAMYYLVAK